MAMLASLPTIIGSRLPARPAHSAIGLPCSISVSISQWPAASGSVRAILTFAETARTYVDLALHFRRELASLFAFLEHRFGNGLNKRGQATGHYSGSLVRTCCGRFLSQCLPPIHVHCSIHLGGQPSLWKCLMTGTQARSISRISHGKGSTSGMRFM